MLHVDITNVQTEYTKDFIKALSESGIDHIVEWLIAEEDDDKILIEAKTRRFVTTASIPIDVVFSIEPEKVVKQISEELLGHIKLAIKLKSGELLNVEPLTLDEFNLVSAYLSKMDNKTQLSNILRKLEALAI